MLSLCIAYNNALFLREKKQLQIYCSEGSFCYLLRHLYSWSLIGLCTSEISTALIKKLHDLGEKCVICRGCG